MAASRREFLATVGAGLGLVAAVGTLEGLVAGRGATPVATPAMDSEPLGYRTAVGVITSVVRYLACPACPDVLYPVVKVLDQPAFAGEWRDCSFVATCPMCRARGTWRVVDRPGEAQSCFYLAQKIRITAGVAGGRPVYTLLIPDYYRASVRAGDRRILSENHWEIIEAAYHDQNFQFHPGVLEPVYAFGDLGAYI